jgi:hypothetical protein
MPALYLQGRSNAGPGCYEGLGTIKNLQKYLFFGRNFEKRLV